MTSTKIEIYEYVLGHTLIRISTLIDNLSILHFLYHRCLCGCVWQPIRRSINSSTLSRINNSTIESKVSMSREICISTLLGEENVGDLGTQCAWTRSKSIKTRTISCYAPCNVISLKKSFLRTVADRKLIDNIDSF